MARKEKSAARRRTRVPVASRASDRRAARPSAAKPVGGRVDIMTVACIVGVLLLVLLFLAVPLRNYYQGRSEIARLHESIAAKQAEKARLLAEIDRYKSDEYIEQEARRRFGVVAQGETAYRIIAPGIDSGESVTTDKQAEDDERPWFEVLWDSVAQPPESVTQ